MVSVCSDDAAQKTNHNSVVTFLPMGPGCPIARRLILLATRAVGGLRDIGVSGFSNRPTAQVQANIGGRGMVMIRLPQWKNQPSIACRVSKH